MTNVFQVIVWSTVLALAATDCVFGPGCPYPCRCKDNARCHPYTGQCPGGRCAYGWAGARCNIGENVAYGKLAVTSDRPFEPRTDGFVDNDRRTGAGCDVITSAPSWWRLGLEAAYRIGRVVIFFPAEEAGKSLDVMVTNSSGPFGMSEVRICQSFSKLRPDSSGVVSFGCPESAIGDTFILFRKTSKLQICEIAIQGFIYAEYVPQSGLKNSSDYVEWPFDDATSSPILRDQHQINNLWIYIPIIVVLAISLIGLAVYVVIMRKNMSQIRMQNVVHSQRDPKHEYHMSPMRGTPEPKPKELPAPPGAMDAQRSDKNPTQYTPDKALPAIPGSRKSSKKAKKKPVPATRKPTMGQHDEANVYGEEVQAVDEIAYYQQNMSQGVPEELAEMVAYDNLMAGGSVHQYRDYVEEECPEHMYDEY